MAVGVESSPVTSGRPRYDGDVTQFFLRTAACDCTCEPRGNAGIREAMRPPPRQRRFPKTFPPDQCLDPNLVSLRGLALPGSAAGDGNRTHTVGPSRPRKQAVSCDD